MHSITFISTIHKEIGKCTADELCQILEKIAPKVIFLEALEDTYSKYQHDNFLKYGVFHEKLEICAIQKYNCISRFDYVPLLEQGLSNSFEQKFNLVCHDIQLQHMVDSYNSKAYIKGFDFLNSEESIILQDEMRKYEDSIISDKEIIQTFNNDIDKYENTMLINIYSYCIENKFKSAVFMCGAAHRKSVLDKIKTYKSKENLDLSWKIYGC